MTTMMMKMMKTCLIYLGFLLLVLHLSAQVWAQSSNATDNAMNGTMDRNMTANMSTTGNSTVKDKNGCERSAAFTLLIPVALMASLLPSI